MSIINIILFFIDYDKLIGLKFNYRLDYILLICKK